MTTNRKWLYSLDVADLSDWFDAEHVDNQFHGATRITNLERLFVDSEQFRQAVSAFAFAHSDDCPTSPTQMVDWLMAPYVDAHSKPHSKTEQMLTEQSESLSDANDDLAPESDVTADAVDANYENATCNNSGENVTHDSREKLEEDMWQILHSAYMLAWMHGNENRRGCSFEKLRREFYNLLDRQAAITERELCEGCDYKRANERQARKIHNVCEQNAELQERIATQKRTIESYKDDARELQEQVDRLTAERDALAHDLQDCERQRERLRQALGIAIDHAHEIVSLVNLDGEVIG